MSVACTKHQLARLTVVAGAKLSAALVEQQRLGDSGLQADGCDRNCPSTIAEMLSVLLLASAAVISAPNAAPTPCNLTPCPTPCDLACAAHRCNKLDSCCESFEHCVSCCLSPEHKPEERRKETPRAPNNKQSGVWGDVFEYCLAVCRTHGRSTSHENAYIGPRHHCFSKLGKPMVSAEQC
jgi:hypothetical protein